MGSKTARWSPDASDAESVSNNRVCLALLRIYRSVSLSDREVDGYGVAAPFWPVLREQHLLLRKGMDLSNKERPGRRRRGSRAHSADDFDDDVPEAMTAVRRDFSGSAELPSRTALEILGNALLFDEPAFRPAFDAMQGRLEALAATQRLASDQNVELLADLLSLSATEVALLKLCCAIEVGAIGSSVFSHFKPGPRQIHALAAALKMRQDNVYRHCMGRQIQLRRSGFLPRLGDKHLDLEDSLRLTRQGTALMTVAAPTLEAMAAMVLNPLPPSQATVPLAWPHLAERGALLTALLGNALRLQERGINVLLYGAPGTGKTEYAAHLLKAVGANGYAIADQGDDDDDDSSHSQRLASLSLSQRFAPTGASVLVLDEAEDVFQQDYNNPLARLFSPKDSKKSWMNKLLEDNAKPVIWISNQIGHMDPAYLRRFTYCLEFPTTPRGVRRAIAHGHLDSVGCTPALIESVASHEHVSPALLASSARFARLTGVSGPAIDTAVRHMLVDNLKAMGKEMSGQVPQPATRFDTHYLNIKGQVHADTVMAGLQRLGRGTLLLSGAPGTGKTQLAAEMALRLGRELVYKTASDINTMWFGESERNVARMFTECDPVSEVLFLDEADTLLKSRDALGHRADVAVTAEFLRHIEAFSGVFVCATNHRAELDAALMRRFTFRLEFLPLSAQQRHHMLCETALKWDAATGLPPPALDQATVARLNRLDQLTPGDFANVVKRVQALELTLGLSQWLDELEAEHQAKPDAARSAMGFV